MTTLADIAEKVGEVRAEVRASRGDMGDLKTQFQTELGKVQGRLAAVELSVAKVQTQSARRRLRERVAVAVAVAIFGALWALIGAIPGYVWVAVAKAVAQ